MNVKAARARRKRASATNLSFDPSLVGIDGSGFLADRPMLFKMRGPIFCADISFSAGSMIFRVFLP